MKKTKIVVTTVLAVLLSVCFVAVNAFAIEELPDPCKDKEHTVCKAEPDSYCAYFLFNSDELCGLNDHNYIF